MKDHLLSKGLKRGIVTRPRPGKRHDGVEERIRMASLGMDYNV